MRGWRDKSIGDRNVLLYYGAVRDELRRMGCLAVNDPALGVISVVDAQKDQPGRVMWSVHSGKWHGSLQDAREINLQGTTGMAPGFSEALARTERPQGLFANLALGRDYGRRLDVLSSVYGPNGTGMHLPPEYPDKISGSVDVDWDGIDVFDPHAVAAQMIKAMHAQGITFSGTSNYAPERMGDLMPKPVDVAPSMVTQWRALGREQGSWKMGPIGGTPYDMPAPTSSCSTVE